MFSPSLISSPILCCSISTFCHSFAMLWGPRESRISGLTKQACFLWTRTWSSKPHQALKSWTWSSTPLTSGWRKQGASGYCLREDGKHKTSIPSDIHSHQYQRFSLHTEGVCWAYSCLFPSCSSLQPEGCSYSPVKHAWCTSPISSNTINMRGVEGETQ